MQRMCVQTSGGSERTDMGGDVAALREALLAIDIKWRGVQRVVRTVRMSPFLVALSCVWL